MANKVILVGRLGKEPEMTYTASGMALCKFTLATSESYKDKSGQKVEKTEWHNITAWGKTAETIRQYVTKGQQIFLEGKIHYNKYQDKDGNNRVSTEITVTNFEFIGSKGGGGQGAGGGPAPKDSGPPLPEEDIPF